MNSLEHTILWRRLDCPGHDSCCLRKSSDGWQFSGTAIFLFEQKPLQQMIAWEQENITATSPEYASYRTIQTNQSLGGNYTSTDPCELIY